MKLVAGQLHILSFRCGIQSIKNSPDPVGLLAVDPAPVTF